MIFLNCRLPAHGCLPRICQSTLPQMKLKKKILAPRSVYLRWYTKIPRDLGSLLAFKNQMAIWVIFWHRSTHLSLWFQPVKLKNNVVTAGSISYVLKCVYLLMCHSCIRKACIFLRILLNTVYRWTSYCVLHAEKPSSRFMGVCCDGFNGD